MSRSYRKPFAAVTGTKSAKEDKQLAARGVRRAQNRVTRMMVDDPELVMPHFRSCPWNDTYNWSRDGSKRLQEPTAYDWSMHMRAVLRLGDYARPSLRERYLPWPPKWFVKLTRK